LANSINPIFLPLFYEAYDNETDFHAISCLAFLIICPEYFGVLDNPLAINQAIQNAELSIDKLLFKTKNSGQILSGKRKRLY
jgi:hypothetical protein